MRQWGHLWLVLLLAVSAALAGAATARAENVFGPKVDDAVAAVAVTSTLDAPISLLVYSSNVARVNRNLNLVPTHLFEAIGAESVTIPVGMLGRLAAERDVTYIAPDVPLGATSGVTDAEWVSSANAWMANIAPAVSNAAWAWRRGFTGKDIGIAVIDSGTDLADEFSDRLSRTVLAGQSAGHLDDRVGHGSFVSSLAGGFNSITHYVGIAPAAELYTVNVSRREGVFTSDVIAGLEWVHKKAGMRSKNLKVDVLALTEAAPSSYRASALDAMIEKVTRAGVTVVIASGNKGADSAVYAPANDPFAITVGAIDDNGTIAPEDDLETSWSTRGTTLDGHSKPDLLAPGRRVTGLLPLDTTFGSNAPAENLLGNRYARMSGTSFAAPQVAGAVAILAQAHPEWTPGQIKHVLKATARPVAGASAGALDLKAAIEYAGTPPDANAGIPYSSYAISSWSTHDYKVASNGNGWSRNGWSGNGWSGNGWSGNGWSGNGWSGNGWSGNGWSGNGWSWYQGQP